MPIDKASTVLALFSTVLLLPASSRTMKEHVEPNCQWNVQFFLTKEGFLKRRLFIVDEVLVW